ncbi:MULTISPECIES: NAD-dependent epimerase/dehydratase family protein [unclassified Bacillus (in: firmicutes)]|uniref:NAD-dependent epimerase/dehydratase family protein n=1 Tax=unclassified Bacillus (in: firmicutes) TaxID=185979 RepID=UPI0008F049D6|nr:MULTISPECIES: NAD-dependent epimerase/dehydratase family protein [unclassified Bacillus (in: firmicutes)]SFA88983.1 2'-hydroxyisoflavone reductase [Bacillus sp. UNCCL13]SFQ84761.1 2'-hydroxyisoflavone reductase [Bacillus sp. cl95]
MKILVLGGSRFLGRAFIEEAQKRGHEISIFNRGNQNENLKNVEILIGDRNGDLSALKDRKWDTVLDTSGFIPRSVRESTQLLKNNVKHYTFISSISVYRDWIPVGLDEDYPLQTMSSDQADELTKDSTGQFYEYYGAFKALCEQEAEKSMPGRVLKVRAGQLVGKNDYTDRFPYWIHRVAKGGTVLAPGNPHRPIQYIDNRDMALWILNAMEKQIVGSFNVTGPDHPVTMQEFLQSIKSVTGSDAEFVWADEKFLMDHGVAPWTEMPLWVPELFALTTGEDEPWKGTFSINISKALETGLHFRSLNETIKEIYHWQCKRNLTENDWKAGISAERERQLLEAYLTQVSNL